MKYVLYNDDVPVASFSSDETAISHYAPYAEHLLPRQIAGPNDAAFISG